MKTNIISINQQGRSHRQLEDAIYLNNEDLVYGVFDGVSNAAAGKEAAEGLAMDLGAFLHSSKAREECTRLPVQEVRRIITGVIQRSAQRVIAEVGCEAIDVACTMVLCILDPKARLATIIHCGDGAVFGLSETYQASTTCLLSHPDNAADKAVYSAQNIQQLVRMRVMRVALDDFSRILLCTDGFSGAYQEPFNGIFDSFNINDVFACQTDEQLKQLVEEYHIQRAHINDDISAIMIRIDNEVNYSGILESLRTHKTTDSLSTPDEIMTKENTTMAYFEPSDKPTPVPEEPFADYDGIPDSPSMEPIVGRNEGGNGMGSAGGESGKLSRLLLIAVSAVAVLSLLLSFRCYTRYQSEMQQQKESISVISQDLSEIKEALSEEETEPETEAKSKEASTESTTASPKNAEKAEGTEETASTESVDEND